MTCRQRPFVLLDRDGTLIKEQGYISDPEQVVLFPHTVEGLLIFRRMGFGLLVITNQSGIGRGYFTVSDYGKVTSRLRLLLEESEVLLDGTLMCPHTPEEHCSCRKPKTGLVEKAAKEFRFDPKQCIVIGDKLSDMKLAQNLGCRSILVRTGYGGDTEKNYPRIWDDAVENILEAASLVEAETGKGEGS